MELFLTISLISFRMRRLMELHCDHRYSHLAPESLSLQPLCRTTACRRSDGGQRELNSGLRSADTLRPPGPSLDLHRALQGHTSTGSPDLLEHQVLLRTGRTEAN